MVRKSINTHLTRDEIIKRGSIYTSPEIVDLVYNKVEKYIDNGTVIGDFGAGYGAFVDRFKESGKMCFATEYDEETYKLLKSEYPSVKTYLENSLINVNREKYGLNDNDKLIIVGNPPYNDTTSIFRKGEKGEIVCDHDLVSRDFGISFLKAYSKLRANYICILHPLAYLIKKQNFKSLGSFNNNYRLISATIFSSKEFESIRKTYSDFPVVAALYEKDDNGMDYEFIKDFEFTIYKSDNIFKLSNILTIDSIVNKYPTRHKVDSTYYVTNVFGEKLDEPVLQFYTLRDMNALIRNAGFVDGPIGNGIDVTIENLYQYSWLYFLKTNFNPKNNKFLYGNLSPLWTSKMDDKNFKNAVVSYAYNNCPLVKKYFSKDKIKAFYGTVSVQYNALYEELNNIYNLFN